MLIILVTGVNNTSNVSQGNNCTLNVSQCNNCTFNVSQCNNCQLSHASIPVRGRCKGKN